MDRRKLILIDGVSCLTGNHLSELITKACRFPRFASRGRWYANYSEKSPEQRGLLSLEGTARATWQLIMTA